MSDLLQSGASMIARLHKSHLSRSVTVYRGAANVAVLATVGTSPHQIMTDDGLITAIETRDYLVDAADYKPGGSVVEPRAGDQIRETLGGVVHVYEVLPPGNEPCFRRSDSSGTRLRIHTKHIGTA